MAVFVIIGGNRLLDELDQRLVKRCVKNVSYKLRYSIPYFFDSNDLLQTGYEAFLMADKAKKTRASVTNFEGYIYKCIEYQIRKEIGRQKLITRICIDDIPPSFFAVG